jgi:hypothetical protein
VIDIAEKEPSVGSEATKRNSDLPPLPPSAMGIRSVARKRYEGLQSPRSLSESAFEAGWNDGYGDGYVDGYDDGQYNQLIGLIRELEDWMTYPINEPDDVPGIYSVVLFLRGRLEHEP